MAKYGRKAQIKVASDRDTPQRSAPRRRRGSEGRASSRLRGLVQTVFPDLVEQGLVADAEGRRGHLPVPPRPMPGSLNQLALGLAGRRARDLLERLVARVGGDGGVGRR